MEGPGRAFIWYVAMRPKRPAVWASANATGFVARGLNVTMLQDNVSNAFRIESVGFECSHNTMHQVGSCLWPNYGPGRHPKHHS